MREIKTEELQKHRIFLASPQFGGQCHSIFARGLGDLAYLCGRYAVLLDTCFWWNEALVTRARNYCVDEFLRSPADHLLFIDGDIGFKAQDAMELLILQIQNPEYDIIGGMYRKKDISGQMVFNSGVQVDTTMREPVEVDGIGTGFMLIRREVFDRFAKAFPQYAHRPDNKPGPFDGHRLIMQYFQAEIDPDDRRYLSEDYWFSRRCKEIGIRTWLCPWMRLRHAGMFIFE